MGACSSLAACTDTPIPSPSNSLNPLPLPPAADSALPHSAHDPSDPHPTASATIRHTQKHNQSAGNTQTAAADTEGSSPTQPAGKAAEFTPTQAAGNSTQGIPTQTPGKFTQGNSTQAAAGESAFIHLQYPSSLGIALFSQTDPEYSQGHVAKEVLQHIIGDKYIDSERHTNSDKLIDSE